MTNERIMDKVRKLLALASDPGASPNEAETASRQAASLMAKYNIELSHLDAAELEKEWDIMEGVMPGCRPGKKNPREVPSWIGVMAFGIKVYTRTRCFNRGGYVVYRGARQDVELAQWMLKLMIDLAYKSAKGSYDPAGHRNGFASAIQSRLKAMAKDRDSADAQEGSTALVVVDKLRAKLDELFGAEGTGRKVRTRSNYEGYEAGKRASIPTGRPVSATGGVRYLTAH